MADSIPLHALGGASEQPVVPPEVARPPEVATSEPCHAPAWPLSGLLPTGRLIEISGDHADAARTTTTISVVKHAQAEGELVAWVQPRGGALYPPDLDASGIDLASLVCVHVPPDRRNHKRHVSLLRATELLLRSGAFGLVVLDLSSDAPLEGATTAEGIMAEPRWQGRLAGVLREHGARLILLTHKPSDTPSLGPMVAMRIEARRQRIEAERFAVRHHVLKSKGGLRGMPRTEDRRTPCGVP